MLQYIRKFKEFALEMVIGLLIAVFGLSQLLTKSPLIRFTSDGELIEKVAAALVTIGGTVLLSGIFRFAFSIRLDNTENRILDAMKLASREFIGTISNLQPKGLSPRPHDQCMAYRYIYWKTKDEKGTTMWLSFSPVEWSRRVLPILDTQAKILGDRFKDNFKYFLAMVQLQNCLAITATRMNPDGTPYGEMAGVYVFAIPIGNVDRLCGHLRHLNMGGRQSLSSCVLSTNPIDEGELDRLWVAGYGGGDVDPNLSGNDSLMPRMAAE